MTSKEIRQTFLDFFVERGHKIVHSSPVVPFDDPTLLFTNAGMNQFKDVFLSTGKRDYTRATDTQKCIRAGGKHNDLEEVGHDSYHHTFFEMLGNWSFGDYYKKEAIKWAWELLTEVWKFPKEKLWATVFETDEESFELWKSETDIDPSHILRFGEKDNFWEMGDTGPCGPCSEIHFDFTENGCKLEDVNAGLDDVIEIWNLVFIQYNRKKDGELEPLPKRHVDTGMGFERIVRVLQNKKSNYETDVFEPIINEITKITKKDYSGDNISSINAIADHIRALTFAISDGAIPSNEGRGYVLRRILRRASRLARKLDYHQPILFQLVDVVVNNFEEIFPELKEKKDFTKEVIKSEEESFNLTLDRGIKLFNEVADSLVDTKIFPGEDAFKLYDTYGFPLDLTEVMATERGLKIDKLRFDEEMEKQKTRAREARKDLSAKFLFDEGESFKTNYNYEYNPYSISEEGIETNVIDTYNSEARNEMIVRLWKNPFYCESGGQISDTGILKTDTKNFEVIDSLMHGVVIKGTSEKVGVYVRAIVDYPRRQAIERNHTATHIVHEALRRVLGSHVKQLGSLVADEYLRFDFPHFHKLESAQIKDIEDMVNAKIAENILVNTLVDIPTEAAKKIPNVKMFFGDKYGDTVRVVTIDENFSVEFCGGTHVKNTSDIGLFRITKEESIAAGTRRIFARTGEGIIHLLNEKISDIEKLISELPEKYSSSFKSATESLRKELANAEFRDIVLMQKLLEYQDSTIASLYEQREKYLEEKKQEEKNLAKLEFKKVKSEVDILVDNAEEINGAKIISEKIDSVNTAVFKDAGEYLRQKLGNGVGLLAAVSDGKINLVCAVSDSLIQGKGLNAGKLISEAAKKLGGGGGGRANLATAGAKDVSKLDRVLKEFTNSVREILSK